MFSLSQLKKRDQDKPDLSPLNFERLADSVQPHRHIQKPVERLSPPRQFVAVAVLQGFRETVEQTPDVAVLECLVLWLTPLMQDRRDEAVGADPDRWW